MSIFSNVSGPKLNFHLFNLLFMSSTFKLNLEITSKYKNNEYIFRHGSKVGPVTNVDANVKYHEFIQNKVKYIAAKIREQTCVRAFDSKAEMRVTKYIRFM